MASKQDELSESDVKWIAEQEALMAEGEEIIKEASNEAIEYLADAVENINDRQWRKMVMSTQAVEIGIGVGIAEHLVPVIYNDMQKNMHKKFKVSKETAQALRHIYIGRVIKNVRKALNERSNK